MSIDLWLPEGVRTNEARTLQIGDPIEVHAFRERLKDVDPNRLDLIRTEPHARELPPNRWLIVYRSDAGMVSWFLIQDEDGYDCVPDERHWDRLMEHDQQRSNGSLLQKFRKGRDMVAAQARAAKEAKREDFRDELTLALKHVYDSSVPITSEHKDRLAGGESADERRKRLRKQQRQARKLNRKQWA